MTWTTGSRTPWIGVDLDGTLAYYPGHATDKSTWLPWNEFGPPIESMLARVKQWRAEKKEVRIITARVFPYIHGVQNGAILLSQNACAVTGKKFTLLGMIGAIQDYTRLHVGEALPVTCAKDYNMIEQWDDRAIQVIPNTGKTLNEEWLAKLTADAGKSQGGS